MSTITGRIHDRKYQTEISMKWSLSNYRALESFYGKGVESPKFHIANNNIMTFMKFHHLERYAVVDLNVPKEIELESLSFNIYIIDKSVRKRSSCSDIIGHVPCHMAEIHRSTGDSPSYIRIPIIVCSEIISKKGFLKRDILTLFCQITITDRKIYLMNGGRRFLSSNDDDFHDQTSSLSNNREINENSSAYVINAFDEFFGTPSFSDLTIEVQNRIFYAHKIILAVNSPVFQVMFTSVMSERIENRFEITDCDPAIFEIFLKSLYTGTIEAVEENVGSVLILADKYQVSSLKRGCEAFIINNLKPSNVIEYLLLAHSYEFTSIKKRLLAIIISCGKLVPMIPDFPKLNRYPDLLAEIMQNMM